MGRLALVALLLVALAGCGSKAVTTTTTPATVQKAKVQKTVWLCLPGRKRDPCVTSLATTFVGPHGATRVETPQATANPPIDCFYV